MAGQTALKKFVCDTRVAYPDMVIEALDVATADLSEGGRCVICHVVAWHGPSITYSRHSYNVLLFACTCHLCDIQLLDIYGDGSMQDILPLARAGHKFRAVPWGKANQPCIHHDRNRPVIY